MNGEAVVGRWREKEGKTGFRGVGAAGTISTAGGSPGGGTRPPEVPALSAGEPGSQIAGRLGST